MSRRHQIVEEVPITRAVKRVKLRSERHRVHMALGDLTEQVLGGTEPDDTVEPGIAFKAERHHSSEKAKAELAKSTRWQRHWKQKEWKRRTITRRAEARAWRQVAVAD